MAASLFVALELLTKTKADSQCWDDAAGEWPGTSAICRNPRFDQIVKSFRQTCDRTQGI